jgi:hypothetical protein
MLGAQLWQKTVAKLENVFGNGCYSRNSNKQQIQ